MVKKSYKKYFKTFTFWMIMISIITIIAHQIGQDSKSIVLIGLNPILSNLPLAFMNAGPQIPCRTIVGSISVYWYIASVVSFFFYGIGLDVIRILIRKMKQRY